MHSVHHCHCCRKLKLVKFFQFFLLLFSSCSVFSLALQLLSCCLIVCFYLSIYISFSLTFDHYLCVCLCALYLSVGVLSFAYDCNWLSSMCVYCLFVVRLLLLFYTIAKSTGSICVYVWQRERELLAVAAAKLSSLFCKFHSHRILKYPE